MGDRAIIGQYWPEESLVHAMDPRVKFLLSIVLMVAVMVMQYLSFRGHASAGNVIVDGILTWDGGIYLLIFAFFALIIVNLLLKAWVDKRGGSAE